MKLSLSNLGEGMLIRSSRRLVGDSVLFLYHFTELNDFITSLIVKSEQSDFKQSFVTTREL